jgi:hypothetical protein
MPGIGRSNHDCPAELPFFSVVPVSVLFAVVISGFVIVSVIVFAIIKGLSTSRPAWFNWLSLLSLRSPFIRINLKVTYRYNISSYKERLYATVTIYMGC